MRSRPTAAVATTALLAALVLPTAAAADPVTVASTLGTDSNLVTTSNTEPQPFSSAADGFGTYQRNVSDSIPFALLDDSMTFASDVLGIVDGGDERPFFGAADTVNDDNDAPLTASWTFDISGATGPLFLNVEAGAMGDFEASSDTFAFTTSIDGAPAGSAAVQVDESTERTYTLEDGDAVTLPDPANLLGAALDDDFVRVALPLEGHGSELVVSFTGDTNGGGEAFAFTNLVITQGQPLPPLDGGEDPSDPDPACDTPDEELTLISEIQGANADPDARWDSPLDRETHTIRAVVTFADADLDGYFVQEEPGDDDADPATSEGLFVHESSGDLPDVGQTVELTDRVTAYYGLTQFSAPTTEICDVPLTAIEPTDMALPLDRDGREALEGMLVTTTQPLEVTGLYAPYAFGELGLTSMEGPLTQPTSLYAPHDPRAQQLLDEQAAAFIKVDDRGEFGWEREPWSQPEDGIGPRPGDTVAAGITGPLTYTFDEYKIEPAGDDFPTVATAGEYPRPDVPTLTDGNDVGAFNVLNYFNTFGDSSVLRGATNPDDFEVQTAKIVDAILAMDAAVLGLIEVENDYEDHHDGDPATVPAIQVLVDELNRATAPGTYDWVVPGADQLTDEGLGGGGLGTDAIAVGLLHQPARATPLGTPATFDIDAELTGDGDNNRWPLAQTFEVDGQDVTVVVNHFKSKGSSCTDTAGPDFDLGDDVETALTGNCTLTREYAARRILDWVDTRPTGATTPDTLVVGDLNAYEEEAPVRIFEEADWTDVVERDGGDAFTYKFDGRYGRLDHVLASPSANRLVTGAAVWQANSLEFSGNLYDAAPIDDSAYASSDHDPVLVSLDAPGRADGERAVRGPRRAR